MTITPGSMTPTPTVREQVDRLIDAGLPAAAGVSAEELRSLAAGLRGGPDSILAVHPRLAPASALVPLLSRNGKPGFVVSDLTDLDEFTAIDGVELPDRPLYLIHDIDRGDDLALQFARSSPRRCPRSQRAAVARSPRTRASAGCCSSPSSCSPAGAS